MLARSRRFLASGAGAPELLIRGDRYLLIRPLSGKIDFRYEIHRLVPVQLGGQRSA